MAQYSINNLKVFSSVDLLNTAAAEFIITTARKAITEKGKFAISLSGGHTPEKLYLLLSQSPFREQIQWEKTFVFWGDERCVPLNDEQNNAHRAKTLLLDKVSIPLTNIYAIPVNLPPTEAARTYEKELKNFFGSKPIQFDLILLGLGENGHTASLFPGTKVLEENKERIREVFVEEEKIFRITMTAPLINQAHCILYMVTGEKKAKVLKTILKEHYLPEKYPAQLIKPLNGELFWYVDKAAAKQL